MNRAIITLSLLMMLTVSAFSENPSIKSTGFICCSWDGLAWNWALNIHNAQWWIDSALTDNFWHINRPTNPQRLWDSLCVDCDPADSIPGKPNKEDLSVFGYKTGAKEMKTLTRENWETTMKTTDGGHYVQNVRGSKYEKPWQ